MRFDLISEHDRFIPGWHSQVHASPMRAEWTRPEWRWPARLRASLAGIARRGLTILAAGLRGSRNTAVIWEVPQPVSTSRREVNVGL